MNMEDLQNGWPEKSYRESNFTCFFTWIFPYYCITFFFLVLIPVMECYSFQLFRQVNSAPLSKKPSLLLQVYMNIWENAIQSFQWFIKT